MEIGGAEPRLETEAAFGEGDSRILTLKLMSMPVGGGDVEVYDKQRDADEKLEGSTNGNTSDEELEKVASGNAGC